jgi:hypothetical protein
LDRTQRSMEASLGKISLAEVTKDLQR